jgi:hypothetical protein
MENTNQHSICHILKLPYDCLKLCLDEQRPKEMRLVCRDFSTTCNKSRLHAAYDLRYARVPGVSKYLSNLPNLQRLSLKSVDVDFSPLAACKSLTHLRLEYVNEASWDPML